jgi:hypothetical protein
MLPEEAALQGLPEAQGQVQESGGCGRRRKKADFLFRAAG